MTDNTKPNMRRAAILAEEARVAAAAGHNDAAAWLERRAFGYLVGQRPQPNDSSTPAAAD